MNAQVAERLGDVLERVLETQGDEHDPSDDREVQVRVGVARELVLVAAGWRLLQPTSTNSAPTSK